MGTNRKSLPPSSGFRLHVLRAAGARLPGVDGPGDDVQAVCAWIPARRRPSSSTPIRARVACMSSTCRTRPARGTGCRATIAKRIRQQVVVHLVGTTAQPTDPRSSPSSSARSTRQRPELTLTHEGLPEREQKGTNAGWTDCFDSSTKRCEKRLSRIGELEIGNWSINSQSPIL